MVKNQHTLTLDRPAELKHRLDYGYVRSIKVTERWGDGPPPFCDQVILRLPFRYGSTPSELEDSWIFFLVNAFASCACLPSSAQAVRFGVAVCGVVTKSPRDYQTAKLAGRSPTSASDWKLLPPRYLSAKGTGSFIPRHLSLT